MAHTHKQIIGGPVMIQLMEALDKEKEVEFTIHQGLAPAQYKVIPRGLEKVPGKNEYDIAVTMLGNKTPQLQHFIYSPGEGSGLWLGTLNPGHRAYAGQSF